MPSSARGTPQYRKTAPQDFGSVSPLTHLIWATTISAQHLPPCQLSFTRPQSLSPSRPFFPSLILPTGYDYCVSTMSMTTTRSSINPPPTSTQSAVPVPTPNQAGNAISNCNKYAQTQDGDYCYVSHSLLFVSLSSSSISLLLYPPFASHSARHPSTKLSPPTQRSTYSHPPY